jgi:hypothetical protein
MLPGYVPASFRFKCLRVRLLGLVWLVASLLFGPEQRYVFHRFGTEAPSAYLHPTDPVPIIGAHQQIGLVLDIEPLDDAVPPSSTVTHPPGPPLQLGRARAALLLALADIPIPMLRQIVTSQLNPRDFDSNLLHFQTHDEFRGLLSNYDASKVLQLLQDIKG